MSDVEFEGDRPDFGAVRSRMSFAERPLAGMAGWLISKGLVKTETQANAVLVGIIIVCLIIGYVVLHGRPATQGGKAMPPNTYYGTH